MKSFLFFLPSPAEKRRPELIPEELHRHYIQTMQDKVYPDVQRHLEDFRYVCAFLQLNYISAGVNILCWIWREVQTSRTWSFDFGIDESFLLGRPEQLHRNLWLLGRTALALQMPLYWHRHWVHSAQIRLPLFLGQYCPSPPLPIWGTAYCTMIWLPPVTSEVATDLWSCIYRVREPFFLCEVVLVLFYC